MTNIINNYDKKAKGKPIEFVKFIFKIDMLANAKNHPIGFDNVELVGRTRDFDIICVWDNDINNKGYYLGHWNDGVL